MPDPAQRRIQRAFTKAAPHFDSKAFLHREIRQRMLARLELVRLDVHDMIDLGAGTLGAAERLHTRFPGAYCLALDFSAAMLTAGAPPAAVTGRVCAAAERLPFRPRIADLVFSNLMLPACPDPGTVLREARRVLRYPGLLCLSSLGPDTLIEWRTAWREADGEEHAVPFPDMHDLGDLMIAAGFTEPVIDREILTITYDHPRVLAEDLRRAGAVDVTPRRRSGLTTPRAWEKMCRAYEKHRRADGRLPATVEVIYGHAWATDLPAGQLDIPVEIEA